MDFISFKNAFELFLTLNNPFYTSTVCSFCCFASDLHLFCICFASVFHVLRIKCLLLLLVISDLRIGCGFGITRLCVVINFMQYRNENLSPLMTVYQSIPTIN